MALRTISLSAIFASVLCVLAPAAAKAATIVVVNGDGPGEGFNDPTPAAPVGGNSGTTIGAQRLIAFQFAADIWAGRISSPVTIRVKATFDPLDCDATGAVLGAAGPINVYRDFTGAPIAGTWYPSALANALHGSDLDGDDDIEATFNSTIGTTCAFPFGWYYGLDATPSGGDTDFVSVLVHELGHGLGFLTLIDDTDGSKFAGFNDTFMLHLENHGAVPADFPSMTDGQRLAAVTSTGNLHWTGTNVRAASGILSAGKVGDHVRMYAPNPVEEGSSVSHWDTVLTPNQVMEPNYTGPLHVPLLELPLFQDIGWTLTSPPAPPANNNFTDATTLSGASGTATGTNVAATHESGEPIHYSGSTGIKSVWWKWTAPATGQALINTTGSAFDTVLAIYGGSSLAALTQIASNDDAGSPQSRIGFHASAGMTYYIAVDGKTAADSGAISLAWALDTNQGPASLVAAILPYARSVQVGQPATAFATIINSGGTAATKCSLQMPSNQALPGTFQYQTASPTNTLTGTLNTPADIPALGGQQYVFGFTPAAPFAATDIRLIFDCENTAPVESFDGLNTFLLSASATPVADMIAVSATTSNNGILELPGAAGQAAFGTAAVNIGAAAMITAVIDTGATILPLDLSICQTNGAGVCLAPAAASTATTIANNQTVTYSIFGKAKGTIPLDGRLNRIYLRLKTNDGVTRGATSVAVRTQ